MSEAAALGVAAILPPVPHVNIGSEVVDSLVDVVDNLDDDDQAFILDQIADYYFIDGRPCCQINLHCIYSIITGMRYCIFHVKALLPLLVKHDFDARMPQFQKLRDVDKVFLRRAVEYLRDPDANCYFINTEFIPLRNPL